MTAKFSSTTAVLIVGLGHCLVQSSGSREQRACHVFTSAYPATSTPAVYTCVHSSTVSIVQGSRLAVPVTDAVVPAPRPTARPVMDASYRCTDREYRRNFATDAAIVATCERVCNFLRE